MCGGLAILVPVASQTQCFASFRIPFFLELPEEKEEEEGEKKTTDALARNPSLFPEPAERVRSSSPRAER